LYDAYFTDDFDKHFKKLTKKDGQLKNRLKTRIEEMKLEKPINPLEYTADLKGMWKMIVGDYRMLYAYCEDCRAKGYERFNQCFQCKEKDDSAIVYFDVIHRSEGYDNL